MYTEPTNEDRADRAMECLNNYSTLPVQEEDNETLIKDLLADLMHLSKREGFDWNSMLLSAEVNFNAEVAEEEDLDDDSRSYGPHASNHREG